MIIGGQTGGSVAVPIATMTRAEALSDGRWRVIDAAGESHIFSSVDWDIAVEMTPTGTLPALPGTYVVSANLDDDSPAYWRTNIVGWMVGVDTAVRPITVDPEALLAKPWHVLHPDGRVEASSGDGWDSVDEWLTSMRSERELA